MIAVSEIFLIALYAPFSFVLSAKNDSYYFLIVSIIGTPFDSKLTYKLFSCFKLVKERKLFFTIPFKSPFFVSQFLS